MSARSMDPLLSLYSFTQPNPWSTNSNVIRGAHSESLPSEVEGTCCAPSLRNLFSAELLTYRAFC